MSRVKVCSTCGVPRELARTCRFEDSGVISDLLVPGSRTFLYEVDWLDGLFRNLEGLVGEPVGRIISEGIRKDTLAYFRAYLSGGKAAVARSLFRKRVYQGIADLGPIFGYGHFKILETRRGGHVKIFGRNIYCIPLITGEFMGVFNLMERLPAAVRIEESGDGHLITVTPGEEPEE